jgi:hypothetical protein
MSNSTRLTRRSAASSDSSSAHMRDESFSARVLKSKSVALLDRLDSAFEEGKHNRRADHSHQLMRGYGV